MMSALIDGWADRIDRFGRAGNYYQCAVDTQLESWSRTVVTRNLSTSFRVVEEINFTPTRFSAHQSQAKLDDNYRQDGRKII